MYDYWYYPNVQVYYNYNTGMYFYLGSGGVWITTRTLPPRLRYRLGSHVSIHSRYQRPYREYHQHRRSYPPRKRDNDRRYERRNDYREPQRHYQAPPQTWRELNQRQEQHQERRYPPRDSDRRDNREPASRGEAPRKYPILKKHEKNQVQDKNRNKQKHSGKDQKGNDKKGKGKKDKGKKQDRKDRGDDRSDKNDDQNRDNSREWERRVR
jgi:hypothetical protein